MRRGTDPPVAVALTLDDLKWPFGGVAFRGVAFAGAQPPIKSGFSFRGADGLICYGVTKGGRVTVLGIGRDEVQPARLRSAAALAQISREFELELVHWCRCGRFSWDYDRFRQLVIGA